MLEADARLLDAARVLGRQIAQELQLTFPGLEFVRADIPTQGSLMIVFSHQVNIITTTHSFSYTWLPGGIYAIEIAFTYNPEPIRIQIREALSSWLTEKMKNLSDDQ